LDSLQFTLKCSFPEQVVGRAASGSSLLVYRAANIPEDNPMTTISVSIDVPDLEQGVGFYSGAFGFAKVAEPYPGVIVLSAEDMTLCLLEKPAGSKPSPNTTDIRGYHRHWTPVHLDFHVDDFIAAIDRAVAAGAVVEQRFDSSHGAAAFCSDPFGNGFCLIQRR
jgi:predicted enzyme related to lactoylglutathione lyase